MPKINQKIATESDLERKEFIWFTHSDHSLSLREAEAGTQGKNMLG